MGTTYQTRSRASQNFYRVFIPILVALSLLASQLVPFAGLLPAADASGHSALDNTDWFEIDGNATTDAPADTIDWDSAAGVEFHFDEYDTVEDIGFRSGKKEQDQSDWAFRRNQVTPAKSDLVRTFATGGFAPSVPPGHPDHATSTLEPHLYFGFEILDPHDNNPSFQGNMEFNQSEDTATYDVYAPTGNTVVDTIELPVRTEGDIAVAVTYSPAEIEVFRWTGTQWVSQPGAARTAANTHGQLTNVTQQIGGGNIGVNRFVEAAVNLSDVFGATGCNVFSQAYAKTRTADPFNANLVDVTLPMQLDIDFCGSVSLQKVDTLSGDDGPNGLAGATFEVWQLEEEGGDVDGPRKGACETAANGLCTVNVTPPGFLDDLDPREWYRAVEIEPPPGYKLTDPPSQDFQVDMASTTPLTFANPPVDHLIEVAPDGDNAAGNPHDFEVSLYTDYVWPYEDGQVFQESMDTPDIPVEGATVTLSWDGDGDVKVGAHDTQEADWDTIAAVDPSSSFTCITDQHGLCYVRVFSDTPDQGTLSATYDLTTTYQHTVAGQEPASQTAGQPLAAITDSAVKTWYGFRVELTPPSADNPLGVDHEFTATVWEVAPDGEGGLTETLAGDVEVDVVWEAPDGTTGSGILDDQIPPNASGTGSCTTESDEPDEGTCPFTVRSPDGPGTGTLSVTRLEGEVVGGDTLEVHYVTRSWLEEDAEREGQVVDATKTWWDYQVTVEPDGTNPLGEPHPFKIIVERTKDGEIWEKVPNRTWLTLEFPSNEGGVGTIVSDECSDPEVGTTDGVCNVTVQSNIAGTGVLTVTGIAGTTLPGYNLDEQEVEQPFSFTTGDSATKHWASYSLHVDPPEATNLLPDHDDHTFTVTLTTDNEGAVSAAGQTVDLKLESGVVDSISVTDGSDADQPVDIEVDEDGTTTFTCTTTQAGSCQVMVTTTGPGSATLAANFSTEIGDETFTANEAQGEKLWTTFRVRVTPDAAQNLLGTPHEFTVWVERTDDGDDWYPIEGAQPTLSATAPGIITGTDCTVGTAEDGSCTVTVNTTVAGQTTLTAEYEGTIGEQSSTFPGSGTKQWIDYRVSVDPDEAENLVDTDHIFTVTVESNPGGGFAPLSGAVPTLDLDGVGEITATDCDEGTGEDGTCTVTVTSDEPGLSTLTATYVGSAGIGEQEAETAEFDDSGDKLWVDYTIDVDPDEAVNALDDPHVFTVTLERDEGDGPFAVDGEVIDLAIEGPGTITSVEDGDVDDGARSATCTTDGDGTCAVTVVSGEPGTTILTASYGAEVGETTGTFTGAGTKHWAAIDLVKEALIEPDEDGIKSILLDEGGSETVTYEYTITNIGPVPLNVTSLVDDVLGTIILPAGLRLEPGGSTTVEADDLITSEISSVTNTGIVIGVADDGTTVAATDVETVFVTEVAAVVLEPGVSVDKSVVSGTTTDSDGNEVVSLAEGETATIGYEFLVTNTGDDVLVDLTLVDDKIGNLSEELREAALAEYGVAALPVGDSVVVEATYETTAADFVAGRVTNVVDVGAVGSESRTPVTDDDSATVAISEVLAEVQERPLPRTGADVLQLFALGLLTAVLGLGVLLTSRRRQHE